MGWIESREDRDRIARALLFSNVKWAQQNALEWITNTLDQSKFGPGVVLKMARARVIDGRKVLTQTDPDEGEGARRECELKWFAVCFYCDETPVFFKFKFLRDSSWVKVVSVHPPLEFFE